MPVKGNTCSAWHQASPTGTLKSLDPSRKDSMVATPIFTVLMQERFGRNHSASFPTSLSDGKLYDAYVLYPKPPHGRQCPTVATLALQALPEVLERQCGYKLFIFGRDEFPGQGMF